MTGTLSTAQTGALPYCNNANAPLFLDERQGVLWDTQLSDRIISCLQQ